MRRETALELALGHCAEVLDEYMPAGHEGDEETGEHDPECQRCKFEAALAHVEDATMTHPCCTYHGTGGDADKSCGGDTAAPRMAQGERCADCEAILAGYEGPSPESLDEWYNAGRHVCRGSRGAA